MKNEEHKLGKDDRKIKGDGERCPKCGAFLTSKWSGVECKRCGFAFCH